MADNSKFAKGKISRKLSRKIYSSSIVLLGVVSVGHVHAADSAWTNHERDINYRSRAGSAIGMSVSNPETEFVFDADNLSPTPAEKSIRLRYAANNLQADVNHSLSSDQVTLKKNFSSHSWLLNLDFGGVYKKRENTDDETFAAGGLSFTKLLWENTDEGKDCYRSFFKFSGKMDSDDVNRFNFSMGAFPGSFGEMILSYRWLQRNLSENFALSGQLEDNFTENAAALKYTKHLTGNGLKEVGLSAGYYNFEGGQYDGGTTITNTATSWKNSKITRGWGDYQKVLTMVDMALGQETNNGGLPAWRLDLAAGWEQVEHDAIGMLPNLKEDGFAWKAKGAVNTTAGLLSGYYDFSDSLKKWGASLDLGGESRSIKIYYEDYDYPGSSNDEQLTGLSVNFAFISLEDLFSWQKQESRELFHDGNVHGYNSPFQPEHVELVADDYFSASPRSTEWTTRLVEVFKNALDPGISVNNAGVITVDAAIDFIAIADAGGVPAALSISGGNLLIDASQLPNIGQTIWVTLTESGGKNTLVKIVTRHGSVIIDSIDFASSLTPEQVNAVKAGTITINDTFNQPPTATTDSIAVTEDTPLNGSLAGTDPENDTLTFSKVSEPTKGTLVINANGTFTYTPNANETGADSFSYKVNDGTADSATKIVNVTIGAVNDAPSDIVLSASSIAENSANDTDIATISSTDVDGPSATYSIVSQAIPGAFKVAGDKLQVADSAKLDYETATSNTVTIRVDDGANTYDKEFTINITDVIELPSSAPANLDLEAGSDTGISSTDNITNDNTPTFNWNAVAGATGYKISTDNGSTWTDVGNVLTKDLSLTDGTHNIKVLAYNAAGDGPESEAVGIEVDTVGPVVTLVANANIDTGVAGQTLKANVSTDLLSSDLVPGNFKATMDWFGQLSDVDIIDVDINGDELTFTLAEINGLWAGGTISIENTANIKDVAGNSLTSGTKFAEVTTNW